MLLQYHLVAYVLMTKLFKIAIGLRLGVDISEPHSCVCGDLIDVRGSHVFSCKRNRERIFPHNYFNNIIHLSLACASVPATKEPQGLSKSDGKRPDSLTLTL